MTSRSGPADRDRDRPGGVAALGDVADRLCRAGDGTRVTIDDIVAAIGKTGLLPLLLIPALLAATPLSGIPGVTAVCGVSIAAISGQLLLGARRVHLPATLRRRAVPAADLRSALARSRPVIDWMDRRSRPRLRVWFHKPLILIPEGLCLVSGLAMPVLELIPFSGSVAASGVVLLAVSMMIRDGVLLMIALAVYGVLGWVLVTQLL